MLALRETAERRARGLTLVDGVREVGRALDAGTAILEAWMAPGAGVRAHPGHPGDPGADLAALAGRLAVAGVPVVEAAPELLERLAYGERGSPVVAVVRAPSTALADLLLPDDPLVCVLEGVEKPGNLGAVARSADGAGVHALIAADPLADPWHPNAIRASLGTLLGLPVAVATSAEVLAFLRARGLRIAAARVDGAVDHDRADLAGPLAIVLGSEALGLSGAWDGPDVTAVRIPMLGRADSLNVSASAAVLFYEALRQRRAAGEES